MSDFEQKVLQNSTKNPQILESHLGKTVVKALLPIIQVSSVLKELPVLSLIVLVRAISEKVCPGLMTSSTTLCILYW